MKRHCSSLKHMRLLKEADGQQSISSVFDSRDQSLSEQVMVAELYFTCFIVEHNLPFASSDHFTNLCKVMFPDSQIAQRYACGRTKTKAIVSHAIAPMVNARVIEACVQGPFTILCDGGNDRLDRKYFAIIVRFWDESLATVVTRFLGMPVCNIATGQALFDAVEKELSDRSIPWENAVGFASDSASVMVGVRNSVLSCVREKQPKIFSLACVCHLAALAAAAGLKALPFSVDNLLIDIYYHCKHSSKHCQEFADVLEDFLPVHILKYCTTRWLSLEKAVKRLLHLWPALHAYFDRESEGNANERVRRISKLLSSVQTKLFIQFVAFVLRPLNSFNTAFQAKPTKIYMMQQSITDLLHAFLANFVKQEVLLATSDITSMLYSERSNQVSDDELGIGTAGRLLLIEEEDAVTGTRLESEFFSAVGLFYEKIVAKILAKFPFQDQVLHDLNMI